MTVCADRSEAYAVYFRVLAGVLASPRRLCLRGLDARRRYRVDNGPTMRSDLLMNAGLPVSALEGDFRSVAWHLTS